MSAVLAIVMAVLAAAAPEAAGAAGGETVVRAQPQSPAAPREDQASAASVVLPDDSPAAYDDLAALMREVPGVNVVRTGSIGAASTITLRGSNADQVRVFVDGVPVNIAAGGGVDVSTLPIGDVESVEVYRGSSPLAFGESAMGGVISITTRTPGQARARARSGMGSFGTMFGDASAGGRLGRLRLYAGAHVLSSRGDYPYLNDNGTALNPADDVYGPRQNNDLVQGDGVLRAALTLAGRRTLGLGVMGFAREQGLPGLGRFPTVAARFRTTRGIAYLRYESRDDLGPGGRLSSELYASLARDALDDPQAETGLGGPASTRNTTSAVGGNVYAARPFGDWARAAAILQARARELPAGQQRRIDPHRSAGAARGRRRRRRDRSARAAPESRRHPLRARRGGAGRGQSARRGRRARWSARRCRGCCPSCAWASSDRWWSATRSRPS